AANTPGSPAVAHSLMPQGVLAVRLDDRERAARCYAEFAAFRGLYCFYSIDQVLGTMAIYLGDLAPAPTRAVVGADGLHSMVARAVQAPTYNEHPSLECAYFSYFSGVPVTDVEWCPRPGCMAIAFPTNDGRTMVAAARTNDQFHAYRSDIE